MLFVNILITFADGLYIPEVKPTLILGVVGDVKISDGVYELFICVDVSVIKDILYYISLEIFKLN